MLETLITDVVKNSSKSLPWKSKTNLHSLLSKPIQILLFLACSGLYGVSLGRVCGLALVEARPAQADLAGKAEFPKAALAKIPHRLGRSQSS